MLVYGAYEAKTKLSALLDAVEAGETVTITRRGSPVAQIVPIKNRDPRAVQAVIDAIADFRKGKRLGGIPLRELIDAGRKR